MWRWPVIFYLKNPLLVPYDTSDHAGKVSVYFLTIYNNLESSPKALSPNLLYDSVVWYWAFSFFFFFFNWFNWLFAALNILTNSRRHTHSNEKINSSCRKHTPKKKKKRSKPSMYGYFGEVSPGSYVLFHRCIKKVPCSYVLNLTGSSPWTEHFQTWYLSVSGFLL